MSRGLIVCLSFLLLLIVVGSGFAPRGRGVEAWSPAVSAQAEPARNVFVLPGDGIPNNNGSIGPFPGTGETLVVMDAHRVVRGYVYFYGWTGQAYNVGNNTSYVPDFYLLLVAMDPIPTTNNSPSRQVKGRIDFPEGQVTVGMEKVLPMGPLTYHAKVIRADHADIVDHDMFHMGTLQIRVTVDFADAPVSSSSL